MIKADERCRAPAVYAAAGTALGGLQSAVSAAGGGLTLPVTAAAQGFSGSMAGVSAAAGAVMQAPAGGGAPGGGRLALDVRVVGNGGLATLIMQMIRTGKIQIQAR